MTPILGFLALLTATDATRSHIAIQGGQAVLPGHRADVEVCLNGTIRHGQIIVTRDGCVHLEDLDEQTRRWASEVIRRASCPSRGWDDRTDPVRSVWCRLGRVAALAEVHTRTGSLTIACHRLFPDR